MTPKHLPKKRFSIWLSISLVVAIIAVAVGVLLTLKSALTNKYEVPALTKTYCDDFTGTCINYPDIPLWHTKDNAATGLADSEHPGAYVEIQGDRTTIISLSSLGPERFNTYNALCRPDSPCSFIATTVKDGNIPETKVVCGINDSQAGLVDAYCFVIANELFDQYGIILEKAITLTDFNPLLRNATQQEEQVRWHIISSGSPRIYDKLGFRTTDEARVWLLGPEGRTVQAIVSSAHLK